jgi:hypothetical protein
MPANKRSTYIDDIVPRNAKAETVAAVKPRDLEVASKEKGAFSKSTSLSLAANS